MSGIDRRSAAFLREMGITPLWTPRAAPAAGEAPANADPAAEPDIASMGWDELKSAIASCTRCGTCAKPVYGSGPHKATWMVVAGATTVADEQAGLPLAGEPGKLLANMLGAVGLVRESDVYATNLVKCRPTSASGAERAPTPDEAEACRPFLERELVLSGAPLVLTLGQIAANGLLGKPLATPLAGTRGQVHAVGGARMVATLHPGELLRRGSDKALAWADLCLAKAHDGRAG